jgi:hypothetical protein
MEGDLQRRRTLPTIASAEPLSPECDPMRFPAKFQLRRILRRLPTPSPISPRENASVRDPTRGAKPLWQGVAVRGRRWQNLLPLDVSGGWWLGLFHNHFRVDEPLVGRLGSCVPRSPVCRRAIILTGHAASFDALQKHDRRPRQKPTPVLLSPLPQTLGRYLGLMPADVPESG